ncbi:MAG: tRNA-dihydrouridine synthase family protein [Planctomycetota bacterium]|nr:tRNA-dihydrouridine synthase family protein [Planctomycetota bacterium]
MPAEGNNATPPSPAIAPGSETIDPRAAAHRAAVRHQGRAIDPRLANAVPGFDAPFFQAGLAGYSDAAMRIIARRHGCPLCITEALLDRTLLAGGRGFVKADLGELHDNVPGGVEDHPLVGQIMGSDPAEMAAAALKMVEQGKRGERSYRRLAYAGALAPGAPPVEVVHLRLPGGEQLGRLDPTEGLGDEDDACGVEAADREWAGALEELPPEDRDAASALLDGPEPARPEPASPPAASFQAIDVNLACPVKKISSKARGGHWLAEPDGAIEILKAVREAVPAGVPCSVKLRRSFDDTPEMVASFHRIFDAAYDLGYLWTTVHARTVVQKYIGPSRWTVLRDLVRAHPDRLIFGSGDVWSAADIFRMIDYAGVAAVSVARGCIGNPWIFRQARQMLAGEAPTPPTLADQRSVLLEHFRLALTVARRTRHPEDFVSKSMRKFGIKFAGHHPSPTELKAAMIQVSSLAQWRQVVDRFYPTAQPGE